MRTGSRHQHLKAQFTAFPTPYEASRTTGASRHREPQFRPYRFRGTRTISMSSKMVLAFRTLPVVLLACILPVAAHEHHNELTEEQMNAPVDAILWIHIFLQATVWGILFPIGMVLGLSRSRWHVPLQVRVVMSLHSTGVDE